MNNCRSLILRVGRIRLGESSYCSLNVTRSVCQALLVEFDETDCIAPGVAIF